MHMKSTHSADGAKTITGSTKRHIGSRLNKASIYAGQLVSLLQDQAVSKASSESIQEARAYYVSLAGSIGFEKQNWEQALSGYSEARLIYASLARSTHSEEEAVFQDILSTSIDPIIRYAAYQVKLPRTTSIEAIVAKFVSHDNEFVKTVLKEHPEALDDPSTTQKKVSGGRAENVPKTIQWKSRTVGLEDSATAQALAEVSSAEGRLSSYLSSNPDATPRSKGAAYDEVLIPSQDAVDAIKIAIDELLAEGVSQSDRRMQSLQVTRTAVNYALIGWRIGRNRVMCGEQDGGQLESSQSRRVQEPRKDRRHKTSQEQSTGRRLKILRERVVLYDSNLQSLESVIELPGVAADPKFVGELESKKLYFEALRCLSIGRAHALLELAQKALALFARALDLITSVSPNTLSPEQGKAKPPNLDVTQDQADAVQTLLESVVTQHRALVELHSLKKENASSSNNRKARPLVERLGDYPPDLVDLTNLVTYPPKVEPIPVKPLFLDVAFNYIDYPGRGRTVVEETTDKRVNAQANKEEKKEGRKGWFGFGR